MKCGAANHVWSPTLKGLNNLDHNRSTNHGPIPVVEPFQGSLVSEHGTDTPLFTRGYCCSTPIGVGS